MKTFTSFLTRFGRKKITLISVSATVLVIAALNLVGYISGPIPMMCLEAPEPRSKPSSALDLSGDMQGPGTVHCYSPAHKEFWDITKLFHLRFFWTLPTPKPGLIIHLSYPSDFSDDKNLIGGASNVFVAKVTTQTGNKETSVGPRTQYTVEIISNIKGDLSGVVTVDQLGGYKNGQLVTIEDTTLERYLLQPGSTYLLATRYNEKENWYTLNPHPNASKLLSTDGTRSTTELQLLADQDPKVKALEAAYPEEKLLDADIAHNNTRNEFKSLSPEAKAVAQSRADAAKAVLGENMKGQ